MTEKKTLVTVGCVVLFVLLVALMIFEMNNPQGGVEILNGIFGGTGN